MDSVIFAGYNDPLNKTNATTEYNSVCGGYTWDATQTNRNQIVSTTGKIKNLYVELDAAPGTGDDTYTFTLMYDGSPTALTCAIAGTATSASDTTHEIDVVAGKIISLRVVSSGSPANAPNAQWTMMFSGTIANQSLILSNGLASEAVTGYMFASQGGISYTATETRVRQVCPTAGTISNMYVGLNSASGGDYRFTLRVNLANSNDGSGNPLQLTILHGHILGSDTTHVITVAAGDVLDVMSEPLNSPAFEKTVSIGFLFTSAVDGESLILGGAFTDQGQVTTRYNFITTTHKDTTWDTTEKSQLAQICILKKLYVLLSAAPDNGAGSQSYTLSVRNNAGSPGGTLSVTIAEAATTGNDIANTVTLANGDNIDIMSVPGNTPAISTAYWGLVCYIAPVLFRSYYPHILAH